MLTPSGVGFWLIICMWALLGPRRRIRQSSRFFCTVKFPFLRIMAGYPNPKPWHAFLKTISTTHFRVYIHIINTATIVLMRINHIRTRAIFHFTKKWLYIYCHIVPWKCGWQNLLALLKNGCANCWHSFHYYSGCAPVNPASSWMPSVVHRFIGFHWFIFQRCPFY